jgi:2-amino-4-hydroxy-6-hydroxymethyldihydropteridine diphosphokinase
MDRIAVAIALGSNLGPRTTHLHFARTRLAEGLIHMRASSVHETDPVDVGIPQGRFLNQVVVGETARDPEAVLDWLLEIERARGRVRPFPGAPRTLDLDLVLAGDRVRSGHGLTLPHPRFRERRFVLEPLAEIAPEMVDPVSGKTVRELLDLLFAKEAAASGL